MTTTLAAAAVRIFGGRLLELSVARSTYFLLLAAGLGMLAHGGLRMAGVLESAAGSG